MILLLTHEKGAIVASIATTALQFDRLADTHWTAQAFIVASLVTSLSSVFCASKQQKTIGRLLHASQLREFIGIKKDIVFGQTPPPKKLRQYLFLTSAFPRFSARSTTDKSYEDVVRAYAESGGYVDLPSPASCMLISAPRLLLAMSVVGFVAGVGVYLGSLTSPSLESVFGRDVFVVYCVVTVLSCAFYIQSTLVQWSQAAEDEGDKIMADIVSRREALLKRLGYTTKGSTILRRRTTKEEPGSEQNGKISSHNTESREEIATVLDRHDQVDKIHRAALKQQTRNDNRNTLVSPKSEGQAHHSTTQVSPFGDSQYAHLDEDLEARTRQDTTQKPLESSAANQLARLVEAQSQLAQEQLKIAQQYQKLAQQYQKLAQQYGSFS